jgi:rhodanese-related sulfurtransferase
MSKPLPPITATEVSALVGKPGAPHLLDVREPAEWVSELGHVDGATLIPLATLAERAGELAGDAREIVVICKSGMRAGKAAEFLAAQGLRARVMTGGMMAWCAAGLPIRRDA